MKTPYPASGNSPQGFRFYNNRKIQVSIAWLLLIALFPLASGCNYYRVQQQEEKDATALAKLPNYKRFIVHQGNDAWELTNLEVKEQTLEGTLQQIPQDLVPYLAPKPGSPNRYKSADKGTVLNLVHLYIYELAQTQNNRVHIPVNAIKRIDIVDMDTGATVASHALGVAGALAGAMAIITVIILLTKSSCPYVYAYNGEHFEFSGETYGGAIFSPLERHDYLPLPRLRANGDSYQVKIANELKERQYTNLAELLVVQHPAGLRVLLDQQGQPHTIGQLAQPLHAFASDGHDYASRLSATDSSAYLFNHETTDLNRLNLQFAKPAGARSAKLVLHARNSLWLDYMYGEFIQQFGMAYNSWAKKQKDVPASDHEQWQQEQAIPLQVELKTNQGWKTVAQVPTVGPLAGRDIVLPLDLAQVVGNEVQVRLSSGFMFWELDQAGIDFSVNGAVKTATLKADQATNRQGQNVGQLLASDDAQYLEQFLVGDEVLLSFPVPEAVAGTTQSCFLHTKGYYEHVRDFDGLPQIKELQSFKNPGRFIKFSRERYLQVHHHNHLKLLTHASTATP